MPAGHTKVHQINEPTPMTTCASITHKALYRTRDGAADYAFSFETREDSSWRVYIDNQPSYQGRPDEPATTQRACEGDRHYVDWSRPIASLSDAKNVAAIWADKTQDYIKTGKRFDA